MNVSFQTLDFGDHNPFSSIFGQPRSLVWPVDAYRVTLPNNVNQMILNPFEVVVLQILELLGAVDEKTLAEEICIPIDLVRNVVLRLRDKGLIDNGNMIVAAQRETWEKSLSNEIHVSGLIFRELVGGRFLPFLHLLEDSTSIKTKVIDKGNKLQAKTSRLATPTPQNVRNIIHQMQRRNRAYGQMRKVPQVDQIRISEEPEDYFLECKIGIQIHDEGFRIADPFGMGYSLVLEDVFSHLLAHDKNLKEWINRWSELFYSSLVSEVRTQTAREVFDTESNRNLFPQLVSSLTPESGSQYRSLLKIYSSLEWAFYYCCEVHDPSIALARLHQSSHLNYDEEMRSKAKVLGFVVPSGYKFKPIALGKISDFENRKAELETVLAISFLQADSDPQHPLYEIASTYPDFLTTLQEISRLRGDRGHGNPLGLSNEQNPLLEETLRTVVSTLLPEIQFDHRSVAVDKDLEMRRRFRARISLNLALGDYDVVNKLELGTRSILVDAEKFWLEGKDGDDACQFINHLYSGLQGVVQSALFRLERSEGESRGITQEELKKQANRKAQLFGFSELPDALIEAKSFRIQSALEGRGRTLGASVMALLVRADDDVLIQIADAQSDFLDFIVEILDLRGHGGRTNSLSKFEVERLRKKTLHSIKTILEITERD